MLLLRSLGRFLSPYSKTCMRVSLELLTYPYGRNRANTPVRRPLRGTAKEGIESCATEIHAERTTVRKIINPFHRFWSLQPLLFLPTRAGFVP